jgi:5-methylcytosine-specific restriction endonuclease McrA
MECPTCGKALPTEQGVKQHHTTVHGDPLPNRTCNGCGTDFYDPKSRLEYCDDCDPNAGENNGNWKGAKETTSCERCGSTFEYYPSDKEGIYCSECIEYGEGLDELGMDKFAERVGRVCEQCGTRLKVLRSKVEREPVRFCSQECHGEWISENLHGEDHHCWKGGEVEYGGHWWYVRRQARERDDYTCQMCGTTKEELGRHPDVHHIDPIREFENPQDAHTIDNVVSLCPSCHHLVENGSGDLPDGPWRSE